MSVGPSELVVILLVVFLLFGSRRLADLGKGIGDGIRGFKRGIAGESDDKPAPTETPKEPKQLTGRVETPPSSPAITATEPAPIAAANVPTPATVSPSDTAAESELKHGQ
jgi:sec-independent protein translocase protein TatA